MPKRQSVVFDAPYQVSVVNEPIPLPLSGQVLVRTLVSAISPGTEMLVYRGQLPPDLSLDATIAELATATPQYPLHYGYALVGEVIELGDDVNPGWKGKMVFAFQPHSSHFVAMVADLLAVPAGVAAEVAAFYPNMETAVTFLLDGAPAIGEKVCVVGAGVVGLLTTALLARFPLSDLTVIDPIEKRRQFALQFGARHAYPPGIDLATDTDTVHLADLSYELSGNPAAIDSAIQATGFAGRVVIGSWYGQKRAAIDLGGYFHRSRIRLISSQVSTIAPERLGRWDRVRRTQVAWEMLKQIDVASLISHQFSVQAAAAAYAQIDQRAAETMQVLLRYG